MPVADYGQYCEMLDRARQERFAYPAINVTSLTTANAVLRGLAESRSDGIVQVSIGGASFASGSAVKDVALGAISIAEHVHRVADRYPILVALQRHPDQFTKFVDVWFEEMRFRFERMHERFAAGVEHDAFAARAERGDKFAVDRRRHPRR